MKNFLFNKYSNVLEEEGVNFNVFSKHIINIFLSKGFLGLSILILFSLCLGIYHKPSEALYSLPLLFISIIYYLISKFFLDRDEIILTTNSLIIKTGVFFTEVVQYNFKTIESIQIKQSVLGFYLDYGDVYIHGNGGTITKLDRVKSPYHLKVPNFSSIESKSTKKTITMPKSLKLEISKQLNQSN